MKKKLHFFILIFLCLISGSLNAQVAGDWKPNGPILFPAEQSGQINGIGRVCQIKFHPTNNKKIYTVSASGGLWISNDEATTWVKTGTDNLPRTGCASVCIDYTNDQILYLGTGDPNYYSRGFGIWKSTNGGATWSQANNGIRFRLPVEILMDPTNNQVLITATDDGIWKSTNGGALWTVKKTGGRFTDMVFKPGTPNTIYAATHDEFFRSLDKGETWTKITMPGSGISGGGRIAVTKANANIVYVSFVGDFGSGTSTPVLKSTNSGQSFTVVKAASTVNLNGYTASTNGQGNYNYGITADPANANIVYAVGHVVWKSTNGGTGWSKLTDWWAQVHTDMRNIIVSPYSATKLYNGNDGGVWLSTNGGTTWTPKSNGLEATECYHSAQSPIRKDMNYIGTQDNGELYFSNNAWFTNRGGDWGSKIAMDYQNPTLAYYMENGLRRSFNQGEQLWALSDLIGNDAQIEFTPLQKNVAFAGLTDLWRCTNIAAASPIWSKLTSQNKTIRAIHISPSDANLLFLITEDGQLLRSDNALSATPTFTTLSTPVNSVFKASIAGIKSNANIVYISCGSRVFRSADKGVSWVEVTGSLPGVNIIKIYHDPFSTNESIYVGMAVGIYYKNNTMTNWINYSKGLPTVANITDFMSFNDGTTNSILRVSFYGRGVWESPLNVNPSTLLTPENPSATVSGLDYKYYEGDWSSLPEFNALSPVKTGQVENFNLTPRGRNDNFAFKFNGYIDIPTDGQYTFYTNSDEGSRLIVSDRIVVENDGIHSPIERSGTIGLKAGKHAITVLYFEKTAGELLQVNYSGPGITKKLIPNSVLFRLPPPVACQGTGNILWEQWTDISGDYIVPIPSTAPTGAALLTRFQSQSDVGDNYISRVKGFVCPPYTGKYTFWIASDDESEVWLSTTDLPANKVKIAFQTGATAPEAWDASSTQKSAPINLVAGQKYYIEAIHKEGGGGDHLAVGWQLPNGTFERPIPGNRLLPQGLDPNLRNPENPSSTVSGLEYRYYEGSWSTLPSFPSLTPIKTGVTSTFDLSLRNRDDEFGFMYKGFVNIPADGYYTFYTSSDDGSRLYIGNDNKLVVDNDGLHGNTEKSGLIGLKAGKHAITVTFFDAGVDESLTVSYSSSSIPQQIIPASALYRLPSTATKATLASAAVTTVREAESITKTPLHNYPNPFTGATTIEFSLKETGNVMLFVSDFQGNKVAEVFNGKLEAGKHSFEFNSKGLSTGNYICKMITQNKQETITMIKVSRPKNLNN